MTRYTFGPANVVNPLTDQIDENATGGKFVATKNGTAIPIWDLNGTPLASLSSSAYGEAQMFQADDVMFGLVQFGDAVSPVWANELPQIVQNLTGYMAAISQAVADAQAAATAAAASAATSGGGGLPAGTTLEAIPNGATRLAMTASQASKLSLIADGANYLALGTVDAVTGKAPAGTAKPGDWMPTLTQLAGVQNVAGFGRVWARTAAQGVPTVAEGLADGDIIAIEVS